MSKKDIFIERREGLLRIAIKEEDLLKECYVEEDMNKPMAGEIYKGVVKSIVPSMKSVFIDIGTGKNAYMVLKDKLKKGQELLLEIIKEEYQSKGAKVSSSISLPGRLLVLHTYDKSISFSGKIHNEAFISSIKNFIIKPEEIGITIRTKAEDYPIEDIQEELSELYESYQEIIRAFTYTKGPRRLSGNNSILFRVLRDITSENTSAIYVNSQEDFEIIKESLDERVDISLDLYKGDRTLFDYYEIEKDILKLRDERVQLPGGGNIVIQDTEAMAVIDVNTAKSLKGQTSIENILITNLEAAKEAARQIRLRNISGIILIDFIDMHKASHREEVLKLIREEFATDINKTVIYPFTELGLVQIARRRRGIGVNDFITEPCISCTGKGNLFSIEYISLLIENEIVRIAYNNSNVENILIELKEEYRESLERNIDLIKKRLRNKPYNYYIKFSKKDFLQVKLMIYKEELEEKDGKLLRLEL